jgi:L-asparaginase II
MASADAFVPVAVTDRSGHDESVHFGAVVGLAADGRIAVAAGDPAVLVYPRSAAKPMQAVAMVRLGLDLPAEQLAVACASHDGTPYHLDLVRGILAASGLNAAMLGNTAGLPIDEEARLAVIRTGGGATPLQMNCSGKHAAMLATCVLRGWPTDHRYLDTDHPLQRAVTATIAELTGERPSWIGVDGCGAPAHVVSLAGVARAFRSIATGAAGAPAQRVAAAISQHPLAVGGEHRDVTAMIRHIPGLVAKDGAEGVFAAALPDGRAVALKIADGGDRARPAVMLAALAALGIDVADVEPLVSREILGHGHPVGIVRALAPARA